MLLDVRLIRRCAVAGTLLTGCLASAAAAQVGAKLTTVNASVSGFGTVVSKTALKKTNRPPGSGGDLWVEGTVTTTHVGPYQLQAKLSSALSFTVKVYVPPSTTTLTILTTSSWTTVAVGPGGFDRVNAVAYLIQWGKGGPKNPATAEAIPVVYQVVP